MKTEIKTPARRLRELGAVIADIIKNKCFVFCLIAAPVMNLLIEMLSRRSPVKGLVCLFQHPVVFLYNSLIILATLLIASVFRKRLFTVLLAVALWMWMGTANCVLLGMRVTPFGAADFLNIKTAISMMDLYMKPWQIAGLFGIIILFVALMALLFIKTPKQSFNRPVSLVAAGLCLAMTLGVTSYSRGSGILPESFGNLVDAYDKYGFVYCFSLSLLDQGVDKPDGYTPEVMDAIASDLDKENGGAGDDLEHPNMIMVQLESFFDVNRLNNVTFSENPIPTYTELLATHPSGRLTVPVVGAGTVNTEFEVISGMSLSYFGTGEYPYKTILRSSTCPSICYDLDKYGYTSHAIHNNDGTFYDRHRVYPNLGFDDFTPQEYMEGLRDNNFNWMKDSILTQQILNALDSTEGSDFVYTVSVQPHGRYPKDNDYGSPFKASGENLDVERQTQYQYYASQLFGTDDFIRCLIKALDSRGEPYILALFGDHLPSLGITQEDLDAGTLYQTEYVIVTNTDAETDSEDIYTYQLAAKLMHMAGIPGGVLTTLHETYTDEEEYQSRLELLEYDLLYGDREVLGGENPYETKDMKMGVKEIKITSAKMGDDGLLTVKGENFNDYSVVFVNGDIIEETEIDIHGVLTADVKVEEGDVINVAQVGSDGEPLSFTKDFIYK